MIVDTIVHPFRYPEHFDKEKMLLSQPERRRSWSEERWKKMWDMPIEPYLELAEGVVDKAIVTGFHFPNTLGITTPNDWLAETANRYPDKLAWCCIVDPTDTGAADEVERCVKMGAIGISEISPCYGGYYINDPRCYNVWAKAEELGIPITVHAGPVVQPTSRMVYGEVKLVDEVALAFPKLKIVICHLGSPYYEEASFLIQKNENVFGDVSCLASTSGLDRLALSRFLPQVEYPYFHFLYPILYALSPTFGAADKLIWGSDWTQCSPKDSLNELVNINKYLKQFNLPQIPDEIIHNILHENWKKVYSEEALA